VKKIFYIFFFLLFSFPVFADGGVFIEVNRKVNLPNQKAVVAWRETGQGGEETLLISTKIKLDEFGDFAWVVPIPSSTKPEVEAGEVEIFSDLARLFYPKRPPAIGMGGYKGAEMTETDSVEVVETKKVDIYDIAILKATSGQVLIDWLNRNGFYIPQRAKGILDEYAKQGDFYFIANKVNLANLYSDFGVGGFEPTEEEKECAEYIGSIYRYDYFDDDQITYYAEECGDVDVNVVKALAELDQGVATPLSIKFTPKGAFYPLKVSSLNEGKTRVDVYVFGDTPASDGSGILKVDSVTENVGYIKAYGFNQEYITYLTFDGNLSELTEDAWFEPSTYKKSKDPNYEGVGDKVLTGIFWIIGGLLYLGVFLGPIVVVGLVIIIVIYKFIKKRKK